MTASCLLLGENCKKYAEIERCDIDGAVACALSIGADPRSPSLAFKGNKDSANEDALFAAVGEGRVIMAVADSHFGQWASHAMIAGLYDRYRDLTSFTSIYRVFEGICDAQHNFMEPSETTLALVSVDIATGKGIGVSFGDSSVLLIDAAGVSRRNLKNGSYVSPNRASSLDASAADEFEFTAKKGAVLMLFTDGVDECHYGHPETSIQDRHIFDLYRQHPDKPVAFVSALATLSLAGAEGNPGGQDNLAIAAALL